MSESTVKRALRELERLRRELDAHEQARSEPAAIIGLGCRFPGGAEGPDAYWRLLREGRDAVTTVPPERWAVDGLPPEARWGAFLDGVDAFDAGFFGISPREAARMDPQQRLLLEVAWEALEDAGLPAERLAGGGTGVFVGAYGSEYFWLQLEDPEGIDVHTATGNAHSLLANRLSYLLDLRGPSLAVDTACSSSLTALHLGLRSLRARECDLALVAGVSLMLSPAGVRVAGRALQLAADGRCKAFDARADGIVRGEGCGVVVLKRLRDALADGDTVLALVRGTAMNQDGRTNGLTAPSPAAQRAVLRQALAASGVEPHQVGYVEAHGTGTAVGDPIELDALADVYGRAGTPASPCAVGSVKTALGHLEAAAGIAAVIKAVLALRHGVIPPHLHLTRLNPAIHLEGTRLHIPTTPLPWRSEGPRHAGVSAFSLGGTNVHAILQEAPPAAPPGARPAERECVLPLSARGPEALRRLAGAYARLLSGPEAPPLEDVCFSASVRRGHHPHRLAVVGRSSQEVARRLDEALARGAPAPVLAPEDTAGETRALAEAYVEGRTPDFRARYPAGGRCVPLPRYPWERQRYWLPRRAHAPASPGLLSRGHVRSALPTYEADLTLGAVPFLAEHRLGGRALLPGSAFLELALEAAAHHLGPGPCGLRDVVLLEPLPLEEARPRRVQVTLLPGGGAEVPFRVSSLRDEDGGWTPHATGRLCAADTEALAEPLPLEALQARLPGRCSAGEHDARVAALGLELGATFRRVEEVHHGPGEALGRIAPLEPGAYRLHPAVLDACLQVLWCVDAPAARHVLAGCERLDFIPGRGEPRWSHVRLRPGAPGGARLADVGLYDASGRHVAQASGLRLQPVRQGLPEPLLHGVAWRSRPRRAAPARPEEELAAYEALRPGLDALCGGYVRAALTQLGPGPAEAGVPPRHARLLARLLELEATQGALQAGTPEALEQYRRELLRDFPACAVELELVGRTGPRLADVLRGLCDPLECLFPGGSLEPAKALYERSPFARVYNARVREAVLAAVERLPPGQPLRILEAGAGTGGTTAWLLPALPPGRCEYVFTDVSQRFLSWGERQFGAHPGVRFQRLDLEVPPERQGFEPHQFQVVVAANVVHATRDVRESLRHLRRLLAHDGRLVLLEDTVPQPFLDVTFGLTPGWWRFTDIELRERSPLLPAQTWLRLLRDEGFAAPAVSSAPGDAAVLTAEGPEAVTAAVAPAPASSAPARPWLLLGPGPDGDEALPAALAEVLEARGLSARRVPGGGAALADVLGTGLAPAGVVYLAQGASGDDEVPERARRACRDVLEAVRLLSRRGAPERIPFWLVTRGAHALASSTSGRRDGGGVPRPGTPDGAGPLRGRACDPSQAPLWGLGRVLSRELPELWGGLVDLDPDLGVARAAALLGDELEAPDGEDQLHLSAGERRVARLARVEAPPAARMALRADAGYLISGGLGGMGLELARWMVERGARHVVLFGRRGPSPDALEAVRGLREAGARVEVLQADVTRGEEVAGLLARFGREWPSLRGVVHAAGTFEDGILPSLDWERFERVLGPKLDGAWHLHRGVRERELDFFVLCGSSATLFGPPGLGNYVAANAFLEGLAEHRRHLGLPAMSIAWGPWAGTGMARAVGRAREGQWHGRGLEQLAPDEALAGLEAALRHPSARLGVLRVDWSRLSPEDRRSRFLDEVASAEPAPAPHPGPSLVEQWRAAPPAERRERVREYLHERVAGLLELPRAHRIEPGRSLLELGLDSLLSVELRNTLSRATGLTLPATLLFEHPSLEALSAHLLARLDAAAPPAHVGPRDEEDVEALERLLSELERLPEPGLSGSPARGEEP